jgi:GNAT superfamily N-acetyltransferase
MIGEGDHLLTKNLVVTAAFQNRGLGRKLLAHAEQVVVSLE